MLQVGHQERYVAQAMGLLDLPQPVRQIQSWRCMPPTGRGEDVSVVMDLMIHDLDLIATIFGAHAEQVCVESDSDPFHAVTATLTFAGGNRRAICKVDRRHDGRNRSLRLGFDDGTITLDFLTRTLRNDTAMDLPTVFETDDAPLAVRDPLAFGLDAFVAALSGSGGGGVSGLEARAALALGLAIEEAAGLGHDYPLASANTAAATGGSGHVKRGVQ